MQRDLLKMPDLCKLHEVQIDRINLDENGTTDKKLYDHLLTTTRQVGILQSVTLIEHDHDHRYSIVAGKRRILAAIEAQKTTIPAVVFQGDVSQELLDYITVAENLNRRTNPASEAEAIHRMMQAYGWEPITNLDYVKDKGKVDPGLAGKKTEIPLNFTEE